MKKKRKRTCHVANTSKEPASPLEVAWWGSKCHEALLWAPKLGEGVVEARTQLFLTCMHLHTHTHTHTHTRTFLSLTTCTVQLQGSFSLSQTTQTNKHIQLHLLHTLSPCSSRSRSHSLHWGRADYRWVKFTSLRKLFDITNKVRVYQKTPEDYIIMVCWVVRCTSPSKNSWGLFSSASWLTYQCAEHKPVEVTQERPRSTQRGPQLTRQKNHRSLSAIYFIY